MEFMSKLKHVMTKIKIWVMVVMINARFKQISYVKMFVTFLQYAD